MEKEGRMVFSISRVTGTGNKSLCSLRLKEPIKRQRCVKVIIIVIIITHVLGVSTLRRQKQLSLNLLRVQIDA